MYQDIFFDISTESLNNHKLSVVCNVFESSWMQVSNFYSLTRPIQSKIGTMIFLWNKGGWSYTDNITHQVLIGLQKYGAPYTHNATWHEKVWLTLLTKIKIKFKKLNH